MQTGSIPYCLSAIVLMLSFLQPAQAQPMPGDAPDWGPTPLPIVINTQIEGCPAATGAACLGIGTDAELVPVDINLQIPDFTSADLLDRIYMVMSISEYSTFGSRALVDDSGKLHKSHLEAVNLQNANGLTAVPQHYFLATHIDTLQVQVTLDLHQVRLWPFLSSLQTGIQSGAHLASANSSPRARPPVMGDQRLTQADLRLSIHGERLSVDEVLDIVYLETGCVVEQTAEALVVVACP